MYRNSLSLLVGGATLLLVHSAFGAVATPAPKPAAAPVKPAAAPVAPASMIAAINKDDIAFFKSKVEPILAERCYKCHSNAEAKTKGGLALDSRDGMMKGGDDGKIIDLSDLSKSMFMTRILSKDKEEKMPPKDTNMTPAEIATLTQWINTGAPYPAADVSIASTGDPKTAIKAKDTTAGKSHWAWQPVKNFAVPSTQNPQWAKTTIDNFVVAKLAQKRMAPSPLADRAALIRRAYYDLVGLPPMPWEVQAFIDDKAPNAWEKVIDRLLASPQYGERWGRYWLDVARYSDTKGESNKKESPLYVDAWTYRDYVIDAFNKDKPYDRFIIEQIAADKLNLGQDKRPLAALGFLTVGDRFAGKKDDIINDRIDTVSKAFLGLTVACARCHDHMFDPIPQKDYYSLHGVFASTAEPKDNPVIAAQSDAKQYQEYLKAREDATKGALTFVKNEFEKVRKTFHQHAGDLLMASGKSGQDKRRYLEAIGGNAKSVGETAQMVMKAGGGAPRQNPLILPFMRLNEIPDKQFSEKAPGVCEQIAANTGRGPKVNPILAAAFKGFQPRSMDDVAAFYNKFFQDIEKKAPQAKPDPATKLPGAISSTTDDQLAQLISAPFLTDPMKDFDLEATKALPQQVAQRVQGLMGAVAQVEMTHPGAPKRAMVVQDAPVVKNSQVYIRGEAGNKGEVAPRRFLEILSPASRPEFKDGSGRLELAQAIAAKSNPLTARVMVNRIWQHHFGEGLVGTPDDFGTMAGQPSHPELLDYLAQRFMAHNWSVKAMHKDIMLSAVYQQVTETNETYAKADPENSLLWHYPMRRLDFEPLRDSLLYIAGQLDLKVGGQPVNILSEPYSVRRSVYGYIDRRELPEMMNYFDFANPSMSIGKRHETTVPQQALFMMNSPLVVDVARKLLARPEMNAAKTDAQRVHALYWMVYQRPPKPTEIELGLQYVNAMLPADNATQLASNTTEEEPSTPLTGKGALRKKGKGPNAQLTPEQRKALAQANQKKRGGVVLVNPGELVDRKPMNAWEKYTQALLMANEMVYYN